jgi:hypothetical protein
MTRPEMLHRLRSHTADWDIIIGGGEAYRSSQTEGCVRVRGYEGHGPLKLPARSITTLSLSRGGA